MTGVRAVVFDVFGTLVDYRTSIATALQTFGRERGIACDWYAFVDAWRAAYAPAMDRVRRGELPWRNLDALHGASFDELAAQFGLPPIGADDRAWIVRRWHELEPWPDVREGLVRLRERVVTGTLSNGNVALQVDLVRYARLHFDVLFSAEHFERYKPDPQTYLGAAALLGLEPHGLALAAAHNADLEAAASHGLRTIFIPRPAEYGAADKADLEPWSGCDAVARTVGEIAALL